MILNNFKNFEKLRWAEKFHKNIVEIECDAWAVSTKKEYYDKYMSLNTNSDNYASDFLMLSMNFYWILVKKRFLKG